MYSSPPPSRVAPRPARLLFVDDERLVLRALERLVRVHDPTWELRSCQCPVEALKLLEIFAADVLVTDLSMPGMSGLELLRTVRERFPGTTCMVYSAHVESVGSAHQFGRLAFAALLKPAHPDSIVATLRQAVAFRTSSLPGSASA